MEQPEGSNRSSSPYFSGTRFHRLQSLPGSIVVERRPDGGGESSQEEMLLGKDHSDSHYSSTDPENTHPERHLSSSSLRPPSLFHGRSSPIERPSCIPRQRETPGRDRAMTSPSTSNGRTTRSSQWESIYSSSRSRSMSILDMFPMVNTQTKVHRLTRRAGVTNLSQFSDFSGAHFQSPAQRRSDTVADTPQPVRHVSSIRMIYPEVDIAEIYRPLERDPDPRISRPFMPVASGRSYGPSDIRLINVPPPNTPIQEYQTHNAQSHRAIPVDRSTINSTVDEYLSRHNTFPNSRSQGGPPDVLVGFWHRSMASTRRSAFAKYFRTTFTLLIAIYLIILMATGILSGADQRLSNISIAVVDFDTPSVSNLYPSVVGPYIRSAFEAQFSNNQHLDYQFPDANLFQDEATKVYEAVHNHQYWAAIVIHANATNSLITTALANDTSYNPRLAATIVVNEVRDFQLFETYITPTLDHLAIAIAAGFQPIWIEDLAGGLLPNSSFPITSQTLSLGISFSFLNIRSVTPSTSFSTASINIIYLVLISFYSCTFFMHTHILFIIREPALRFSSLVIYRWCATMTAYVLFALVYSLVGLTVQTPFSRSSQVVDPNGLAFTAQSTHLGPVSGFFTYFALNFIGTAAFGLVSENIAMFLSLISSLPYSLLFLIFWMASNICTSLYSLELASPFYQWGYAWPMHNIVEGTKTLTLGTRSNLTINFSILVGWVALGTIVFPLACWLMRWKGARVAAKSIRSESEHTMAIDLDGRASPMTV